MSVDFVASKYLLERYSPYVMYISVVVVFAYKWAVFKCVQHSFNNSSNVFLLQLIMLIMYIQMSTMMLNILK